MAKKPKYSNQLNTEDISFRQFEIFMLQHEWIPQQMGRDLGEDILIRVYSDQVSTGLNFYVQLKSTTKMDAFRLKNKPVVSYSVDIKDVIDWEKSILPIIFVVWDIEGNEGYWISLPKIVEYLDQNLNSWRNLDQNAANIHIPIDQKLTSKELLHVQHFVASHQYPIASKGKNLELEITLRIPTKPDTEDEKLFYEKFDRFIKAGEFIEINEDFIVDVVPSEWHKQLFGQNLFSETVIVTIESTPSESQPSKFDAVSSNGDVASLPYIDLKLLRQGTEEMLLSNEHQNYPATFKWTVNFKAQSGTMQQSVNFIGGNVQDILDIIRFVNILQTGKAKLLITHLNSKNRMDFGIPFSENSPSYDYEFVEYLEKLCKIQNITGQAIVCNTNTIGHSDFITGNFLYELVTSQQGEIKGYTTSISLSLGDLNQILAQLENSEYANFAKGGSFLNVEIFNTKFKFATVTWEFYGATPLLPRDEVERLVEGANENVILEIPIHANTAVIKIN